MFLMFKYNFQFIASQDDLDYGNVAVFFGAPLITPNEKDITLELGTNATMNCASKHPITWKPFAVSFDL